MAKSTDFWFKFNAAKWLAEVAYMGHEERGLYMTILAHQFQSGRIPEKSIRFLLGSSQLSVFESIKPLLVQDQNGAWYNLELELWLMERAQVLEIKAAAGKQGGRPKKQKESIDKPNGLANDKANENHTNSSSISNSNFLNLKKVLLDFQPKADRFDATTFHMGHISHLRAKGFKCEKEVSVPEGRVDIVVYFDSGETAGIELDNKSPRHKSRVKLQNFTYKIMILRDEGYGTEFPDDYDLLISPQSKNEGKTSQENSQSRQVALNTLHPTVETAPVFTKSLIAQWASTQADVGGKIVNIPDPTMITCPAEWLESPPDLSRWFEEVHRLFQAVNPADIKDFYAFPRGSIAIWEAAYCEIGPEVMLHRAAWYLAFCGASGKQAHSLGGWLKDGGHKHDWQEKFYALPNVGKVLKDQAEQARLMKTMTTSNDDLTF